MPLQDPLSEDVMRASNMWADWVKQSAVSSLEELSQLLSGMGWKNVERRPLSNSRPDVEWQVYKATIPGRMRLFVAYDCKYCEKIITGMPAIVAYDDIAPLAGSKGVEYHCSQCNILLDKKQYLFS